MQREYRSYGRGLRSEGEEITISVLFEEKERASSLTEAPKGMSDRQAG